MPPRHHDVSGTRSSVARAHVQPPERIPLSHATPFLFVGWFVFGSLPQHCTRLWCSCCCWWSCWGRAPSSRARLADDYPMARFMHSASAARGCAPQCGIYGVCGCCCCCSPVQNRAQSQNAPTPYPHSRTRPRNSSGRRGLSGHLIGDPRDRTQRCSSDSRLG
jgi:hypothetical protein